MRSLPAVHALADHPLLVDLVSVHGRELIVGAAREAIDGARAEALLGRPVPVEDELAQATRDIVRSWLTPRPRRVINATGVVIHTNLGRSPVSAPAAEAMRAVASGYSDLEYELEPGTRGSRHDLVEPLLCRLTGAAAGLVVNNNAGATFLVLSALAGGRGVIVSRGQLVEIGGGFRIPEVMTAGGARLVEVGTTNRTRIADYRAAIDDETALLMRVHTSNFRVTGFTEEASLDELVALAREHGLPLVDDLGSGSLLDTSAFGLAPEPVVGDSLAAGADLATFSGDKLLGGPQAGLVVGRADLVARLKAHPFARALRPGKSTLAGLHATLLHYVRGEAVEHVPVWRMIAAEPDELARQARAWADELGDVARVAPGESTTGGGSLPGSALPTTLLVLGSDRPDQLAHALRTGPTPTVPRVLDGAVALDPRTVLPEERDLVVPAVREALAAC